MNKLGVHAFVWERGWNRDEAERAIARTAEVGFDLIEVSTLEPKSVDVAFTRRALEAAGLGATYSLGLDADTDISANDREKERRGQAKLEDAIAMARDIGATHVAGILYSAFQKYAVPTTAEGVKRSVEVIQRVAETAAQERHRPRASRSSTATSRTCSTPPPKASRCAGASALPTSRSTSTSTT